VNFIPKWKEGKQREFHPEMERREGDCSSLQNRK